MTYNTDILNNATHEIIREAITDESARALIEQNGWTIEDETSEEIPGDGCGGGEGPFTIITLWVTIPEDQ